MSDTKRQEKDKKFRRLYKKFELKRYFLKALLSNEFLEAEIRVKAQNTLETLNPKATTKIKNRCIETDRSRAVYRTFKVARSRLHHLAGFGLLPGVRRSSW
jgi:ribosomal protein S14